MGRTHPGANLPLSLPSQLHLGQHQGLKGICGVSGVPPADSQPHELENPDGRLRIGVALNQFTPEPSEAASRVGPGCSLGGTLRKTYHQVDTVCHHGQRRPQQAQSKMSSYAFFMQTCREEHKKKHSDSSVNFSEFSKKCLERWKTRSAKEKSKFEDMANSDKARYDREMKNYVPPKGDKEGKKKDPNAPKKLPFAFFLFCSEHRQKIKSEHPGLSIGDTAKKIG
ncbi:High mobility group protein B1 [Myotis davidii]|uniref:High mobility group protein B1 n=1 Tax=Myotis davidii TaxID=225400 RepID=L5LGI5_MYODS|nr:High mobility group protein B1 [Myotis davidii]